MQEDKFYDALDFFETYNAKDIFKDFFPTVEELDERKVKENSERYIYLLAYYSHDPFKRDNNPLKDNIEYQKLVSYCKDALLQIELS